MKIYIDEWMEVTVVDDIDQDLEDYVNCGGGICIEFTPAPNSVVRVMDEVKNNVGPNGRII